MNKNLKWFLTGASVVVLIGIGFLIAWNVKPTKTCPESKPDSIAYVYGDTLTIYKDTLYTVKWKKIPAITTIDSSGLVTKSVTKDTLLVMDKDSIKVEASADYYPSEDVFDMAIDIDYRRYEQFRVDTVKQFIPTLHEVEVADPLWVVIAISEFIIIIGAIVASIVGG
jgi:hypothetical protein